MLFCKHRKKLSKILSFRAFSRNVRFCVTRLDASTRYMRSSGTTCVCVGSKLVTCSYAFMEKIRHCVVSCLVLTATHLLCMCPQAMSIQQNLLAMKRTIQRFFAFANRVQRRHLKHLSFIFACTQTLTLSFTYVFVLGITVSSRR